MLISLTYNDDVRNIALIIKQALEKEGHSVKRYVSLNTDGHAYVVIMKGDKK